MLGIAEIAGFIIVGYLLRLVVSILFLLIINFCVGKKNKKSTSIYSFKDHTFRFIGYIGIVTSVYYLFLDIYRGIDYTQANTLNCLIWFGMFLPNIYSVVVYHYSKWYNKREKRLEKEEKERLKALAKRKKETIVNNKNAKSMVNMLQSIK